MSKLISRRNWVSIESALDSTFHAVYSMKMMELRVDFRLHDWMEKNVRDKI